MVRYYLCRNGIEYYRIGVKTDKKITKEQMAKTLKKSFQSVEFIGNFIDTIYTDIDTMCGIGNRKVHGGTIVTCKLVYTLLPKKSSGDYFKTLSISHERLRKAVESRHEEKLQKERERKNKAKKEECLK